MATFPVVHAATSGLRFIRDRPKLVGVWLGAQLCVVAALAVPMFWITRQLTVAGSLGTIPWSVIALIAALAAGLYIVQITAIYRAVLRPAESAFAYYRLSLDEARQLGWFALAMLAVLVLLGVVAVLAWVLTKVTGMYDGQPISSTAFMLFWIPACLGYYYCVGLRLYLAPVVIFDIKRIDLRLAWRLTRGLGWRLLGCILLSVLIVVLAQVAVGLAAAPLELLAGLGATGPVVVFVAVVVIALQLALAEFAVLATLIPPTEVYKALAGDA